MFGFRKIMTVILPIVINAENGRARRSSVSWGIHERARS
jgi:hypothetical protein